MKRRLAIGLLVAGILAMPLASWAERTVVLVTKRDNLIEEMSILEIRKAYMGISVKINGQTINVYRLANDERLNQIFMQSVIAMSERSYERRLLSLALKFGQPKPVEKDNPTDLADSIVLNPNSVGYMWRSDAETNSALKIIKVLWQES